MVRVMPGWASALTIGDPAACSRRFSSTPKIVVVGLVVCFVSLSVNPAFASLNLAQAVIVVANEWFKLTGTGMPFATAERSPPAPKEQIAAFFANLETELEKAEFFRPEEKRGVMRVNLRNIFQRLELTRQDVRTLHGVLNALAKGQKGSARGGLLDSEEAARLRALINAQAPLEGERAPRGLAKLLCWFLFVVVFVLWLLLFFVCCFFCCCFF